MKLPHITVELREEESFALGKVSWWLIIGFAVHWAWTYLVVGGPGISSVQPPEAVKNVGVVTSMVFLSITLFCYGIFLKKLRRVFSGAKKRAKIRLGAAVLVCAGTAVMWAGSAAGVQSYGVSFLFGLFTGVGSAVLLMSYGVSFSVCDIATATVSTAAALLLSPFFYYAIVSICALSSVFGMVMCLAVPFIEVVCLRFASSQLVDKMEFNSITVSVRPWPFFLHVFLPSLVFGLILGVARTVVFIEMPALSESSVYMQAFVLAGIASAALIVMAMLTQRQTNNFMFRTLLPVVAALVVSLYYIGNEAHFYAIFALFAGYLLLEACTWVFYADISQRFRISAFTVFGFGRGSFTLGSVISYLLMFQRWQGGFTAMPDFGTLMAAAFITFTLGYSFLPKNAELRNTLKTSVHCPALWSPDDYAIPGMADVTESIGTAENRAGVATAAVAEEPQRQEAPNGNVTGSQTARKSDADAQSSAQPLLQSTKAQPEPTANSEAAAPKDSAKASAPRAEDERMQVIGEVEDRIEADEEEKRQHLGRFKRKCAVVADTYLLSRKETEVLFLLAKGKNSAAIQEQLYISQGTANTHMRRIYRKLDVHSQQELIKLVESVEVDDWEE